MTESVENLVLEHLRHIRGRVDRNAEDMADLRARMSSLEAAMVSVRREVNYGAEVDARLQVFMDKLTARIERIERRLEITDGQ